METRLNLIVEKYFNRIQTVVGEEALNKLRQEFVEELYEVLLAAHENREFRMNCIKLARQCTPQGDIKLLLHNAEAIHQFINQKEK